MRKNIVSICVLALLLVTFSVFGQEDRNKGIINSALIGLEYEVKAGFNIGGTAPMPLPVEIRDITGYNPTMAVAIEGNWTGYVKTNVKSTYLSFPVLATHQFNRRFSMNLGPYFAYMLEGDFSGNVYDGYLREGDPTGNKVVFADGKNAPYDFSKNLRRFQWGAQLGAEWRAFKHLNVYADLTWGLNDIFQKDFDTITFAMYPIYLNVGFGYAF